MYPNTYFNIFSSFPKKDRIFVAMSFNEKFDMIWKKIIKRAISEIEINGKKVEPYRVDIGKTGDSIQTEILKEISESILFIGEISTEYTIDGKAFRNGNVMYEVGIAHSIRLPEEVILIRTDSDPILFDITNIRINNYNKDNIVDAVKTIKLLVKNSIKEIELQNDISVINMTKKIDYVMFEFLMEAMKNGVIQQPIIRTMRDVMAYSRKIDAIYRLLENGMIESCIKMIDMKLIQEETASERIISYKITTFGKLVFEKIAYGFFNELSPQKIEELGKIINIEDLSE